MRCDDSDMKIVPDKPSELFDSSEGAASAFVRERDNGNMEKARLLGIRFAGELTAETKGASLFGTGEPEPLQIQEQRKILFSYIVHSVVNDIAPNSIVAQSAISAFYETVNGISPEIYAMITDSAVYSLYIHSDRTAPGDANALGRVFAHLCGRAQDEVFIRRAEQLVAYLIAYCTQVALAAQMIR